MTGVPVVAVVEPGPFVEPEASGEVSAVVLPVRGVRRRFALGKILPVLGHPDLVLPLPALFLLGVLLSLRVSPGYLRSEREQTGDDQYGKEPLDTSLPF